MNGSAEHGEEASGSLSRAISAQIARALEALETTKDVAQAVHEARRAIKRARAILRLAAPWPSESPTDSTLREASRALAGTRDADILVLTAREVLQGTSSTSDAYPLPLMESLERERERHFAKSGSADGPLHESAALLKSVAVETIPSSGTDLLRPGLGASYEAVQRRSDPADGEGLADPRSHKLRKRVKDLRYQLEFLDNGHPKLGRLVRDLHHLTDLLGDRNDLAMLSRYSASAEALSENERRVLSAPVEEKKEKLRSKAAALTARLFKEDADCFVRRIEAWVMRPRRG